MNRKESTRSARQRNKYPNTTVLHLCKACDAKWRADNYMNRCPSCKYTVPRDADKDFKVIEATRYNTNDDGQIICHLAKG